MKLIPADFQTAASILRVDVATIMAVAEVEAAGDGFLPDKRPKILFEAHIFSRRTGHRFDATHPTISSPKWNRALYKGGAAEWARLKIAAELDSKEAYQSASWGMFQIMGFNWERCGAKSATDFVNRMYKSEGEQLSMFCTYIKSSKLDDELQRKDWAAFARGYNGPSYAENGYDDKLSRSYARINAGMPVSGRLA